MKNIPNILTIMRMLLVPLFVYIFFSPFPNAHYWSLFIFLVAGLTDVLDGYLARRYQWTSKFGTAMDPLADKLMLLTALVCLTIVGIVPLYALIIVYIKEFLMILGAIVLYFRHEKVVVPANAFGKVATVLFSLSVFLLIVFPNHWMANTSLLLAIVSKLIELFSYIQNYRKQIKSMKHQKI